MSENEIGFDKIPDKEVPASFANADTEKMKNDSIKKLERSQMDMQVRAEAGIADVPKTPESIPKELPKILFQVTGKFIGCDKFALSNDEATTMAKHMSIIIGPLNSKIYSVMIIVIVVVSKISDCMTGIKKKFSKKSREERQEELNRMD